MSEPAPPFFSVVIPVYNRAHVLAEAVASVLAQTFQDFEIIVVDDGSEDDPASVIAGLGDRRIHVLRQDNAGGGAARNAGIDAARGCFVALLDSDDIFLPHHLETMKALLNGTIDTVGYGRIVVDRGGGRTFLKPPRAVREGEDMGEYLLCDRGFVPTITVVLEREMAKRVRYSVNLRPAEDTDFAIRLAAAGCRFVMAEHPGAVWRDIANPGRTSAGGRAQRFGAWVERVRPLITHRAWLGARGWAYAKMVARDGRRFEALMLYLRALLHGCYRPRLAGIVFLQIMLSARQYRRLADIAIGWFHAPAMPAGQGRAPSFEKA